MREYAHYPHHSAFAATAWPSLLCTIPRGNKLITAIEEMDDNVLDRNSLDKVLNFLTKKSEMIERVAKFVKENPEVELIKNSPEEFLNDLAAFTKYRPVEKINLWKFRQVTNHLLLTGCFFLTGLPLKS